ncbi:MAG: class I SAM-dependent methyltransferase [Candidatus Peribacteria bacterium]|jgi:predicted O-methyltransferase YrrM|nr:class I SAM-dependent methyltransferase [Candidatus Peribacteria bacterium]
MTSFLDPLRERCEARHIPLISQETQTFLEQLLAVKQPKYVLEIGAAVGYSSIVIAKALQTRGGKIASFEISYPAYLEALKNIKEANITNVLLYPFDINTIHPEKFFAEKFDFVFIDAQKSQYGDYMQKIQPYLCPKTTLLLDDVIKYQNKLTSLYSFLKKNQINYEIFPTEPGDGVMLITSPVPDYTYLATDANKS